MGRQKPITARLAWSKIPLPTFESAMPRRWELNLGGKWIATVAYAAEHGGWFFYGNGFNSLWQEAQLWPTADEAKAACVRWVKEREGR